MPALGPNCTIGLPPAKPSRRTRQAHAYRVLGSAGSIARSTQPVSASSASECRHVLPPSLVAKTPRSLLAPHSRPTAATYAVSGSVGWTTIRPMWCVAASPQCAHVLPPSPERKTPLPHDTLLRGLASPAPTHTTSGFDGATATAPIDGLGRPSKTG